MAQCLELEDHGSDNDKLSADPKLVWDLLLHPHKSMGPHGIHPEILKRAGWGHCEVSRNILEWSWASGEVPIEWKLSNLQEG